MATAITIAPGSNTADVADKGVAGIPARYIARYAAKNPNSKRFELTIANEVYDVTVATPVIMKKEVAASAAAPVAAKPKRIRPSRSKAAIAAREAEKAKLAAAPAPKKAPAKKK